MVAKEREMLRTRKISDKKPTKEQKKGKEKKSKKENKVDLLVLCYRKCTVFYC